MQYNQLVNKDLPHSSLPQNATQISAKSLNNKNLHYTPIIKESPHPSTNGRRVWKEKVFGMWRETAFWGGMSAEPAVQELDGVDGVGAGAVEDLLAAGGARRNDHCRNLLP